MRLFLAGAVTSLVLVSGVLVPALAQTQSPPLPTPAPRAVAPGQPPARDNATPQTGTARIRGRVVAADNGSPLRRAQVRLSGAGLQDPRIAATDEQGRYELKDLPAGRFTLSATKSGYLTLSYGQRRPLEAARPLEVVDAAVLEKIDFTLPKGSVIVAHITDEFGEPVSGATVQAQQYRFSGGQRRLTSVGTGNPFADTTNDLGEIRLFGLAPGEYYVTASMRSVMALGIGDSVLSYAPTYYPGTPSATEAQQVTLNFGQELSVTFPLVAARAARISGVVRNSDGAPATRPSVSLTQVIGTGFTSRGLPAQPDGSFSVSNVLPGKYSIDVRPGTGVGDAAEEFASMPITVAGEDITGLVVTTTKGGTFGGRVVFDTGSPPRDLRPGSIQLLYTTTTPEIQGPLAVGRPKWNDDWTFETVGLMGSRLLRVNNNPNQPSGWFLKAVMLDGKDATDTALDFDTQKEIKGAQIVLTQKRTEVTGAVMDSRNAAVGEYVAVIFPEDREQWTAQSRFIATGRPDQQGRFKILGLPPGRYLATAVEYLAVGEERDPELLDRLQRSATRATLGEGESKTLSLTLASN
jgi:hypothetical protein